MPCKIIPILKYPLAMYSHREFQCTLFTLLLISLPFRILFFFSYFSLPPNSNTVAPSCSRISAFFICSLWN